MVYTSIQQLCNQLHFFHDIAIYFESWSDMIYIVKMCRGQRENEERHSLCFGDNPPALLTPAEAGRPQLVTLKTCLDDQCTCSCIDMCIRKSQ